MDDGVGIGVLADENSTGVADEESVADAEVVTMGEADSMGVAVGLTADPVMIDKAGEIVVEV